MEGIEKTYFHSLYQLATTLNSARSPQDILRSIVENVAKAMDAKGSSLLLLTPDKKELLRIAAHGLSNWYARIGPVLTDKSMSESLKGKAVTVVDATTDERVQFRKQVKTEGIASILSVPVKLREEVIGVLRVYSSEPRQFSDADANFASAAANFGAIALESAKFYQTLQKSYDDFREELLQWNAYLGYEWTAEETVVPAKEEGPQMPSDSE
jgi:GAF domain-containing protein